MVPKMVPAASQKSQEKSEAKGAAPKSRCVCFARNLEPTFKTK